jgi:hypothetical protein
METEHGRAALGLFDKKIPDVEWLRLLTVILPAIDETCTAFERASAAVGDHPIFGWTMVQDTLERLPVYEKTIREARDIYKAAGNPVGTDPRIEQAKLAMDEFFRYADLAFHWGKHHYRDATGGPGRRATSETGYAQRAARTRLQNNGIQFAEHARKSALAGRAATKLAQSEAGVVKERPPLVALFLESAEVGVVQRFRKARSVPLSTVAMFGSWCYSRAAILGMIVVQDPDPFVPLVWNQDQADDFWDLVVKEIEKIDTLGLGNDKGLGFVRLRTGYSELHSGSIEHLEKMAKVQIPLNEAHPRWGLDTAVGLGVGMLKPGWVRAHLESESNFAISSWERAHAAGLEIPAKPDVVSADDQIEMVVMLCSAFLQEYYPEAARSFSELTGESTA